MVAANWRGCDVGVVRGSRRAMPRCMAKETVRAPPPCLHTPGTLTVCYRLAHCATLFPPTVFSWAVGKGAGVLP